MTGAHRQCLREINDKIARYVENLDAGRERASVVPDQIAGLLAQQITSK